MNTHTTPCEKDPEGDFEISAVVNDTDDGGIMIEITHNTLCKDCPLIQECVSKVVKITEEAFDLEEEEVDVPSGLIN